MNIVVIPPGLASTIGMPGRCIGHRGHRRGLLDGLEQLLVSEFLASASLRQRSRASPERPRARSICPLISRLIATPGEAPSLRDAASDASNPW